MNPEGRLISKIDLYKKYVSLITFMYRFDIIYGILNSYQMIKTVTPQYYNLEVDVYIFMFQ